MNKRIAEPLIVNFITPSFGKGIARNGRRVYVPVDTPWSQFTSMVNPLIHSMDYDSVIAHIDKRLDLDEDGMVNSLNIKIRNLSRTASECGKAVLNDASPDIWYLMNPSYDDIREAHGYAPSDTAILDKFHSFETELKWQEHQAQVWSRMADMMPLSKRASQYTPDHLKQLTDPSRGLEEKDLDEFWSFQSNTVLSPVLMGDDMIGMPGVLGHDYDGFTIVTSKDGGTVEQPLSVRSLKTVGMSGIAIPMANIEGNVPKYQIATDPSKINVTLKARTADGVSIQKSEYFDKKKNLFLFSFADGQPSNLRVENAAIDGTVTFADAKGTFQAKMKDDVRETLLGRGYGLPDMIDRLQVVPNAKYIWQSKGTMVGSDKVCRQVSPSNAGFTIGREPKNGAENYVLLVAEGALKGRIVAKYADVKDRDGNSFGDYIAKDSGIIVAQVPGVSKAFVESVKPIYDVYDIKGTYIAMDADGRENLAVANGIDTAYHCLAERSPVKVMSWNPEQKGMDDALLAVAHGKITLSDMGLRFGTPEKLFPKADAKAPNPYRLDGSRANKQEWRIMADKKATETKAKIYALQKETEKRAAESLNLSGTDARKAQDMLNSGEDLARNLPGGPMPGMQQ